MNETDPLEKELDVTRGELQSLLEEQASIGAAMQKATQADSVDARTIIKLQTRGDELPKYIFAARVKVLRARIAVLENDSQNQDDEVRSASEVVHEKWEQLKVAQVQWETAVNEKDLFQSERQATRMDLSTARRELENLVAVNSRPHAPVVRSLPHSQTAA